MPVTKVGYGNPPQRHRFKPGQSGNPKGRPKRPVRTLTEQDRDDILATGKQKIRTAQGLVPLTKAIILALASKALKGDVRAAREYRELHARALAHRDRQERTCDITPDMSPTEAARPYQAFARGDDNEQ